MKNLLKKFGFIAVAAIIGFSIMGCVIYRDRDDDPNGGNTNGNGNGNDGGGKPLNNTKEKAILVEEGFSTSYTISASGENWFKFKGSGDPIIFETTGDDVDTYMEINKLEGGYWGVASDDNSGSGNNALCSFIPERGEIYTIKITTRNSTKGTYTFVVKEPENNLRTNPIQVYVGKSTSKTIYKDGAHWFKFIGTGERVFFETEGNVVNTKINIYIEDSSNSSYSKQENKGINFFTALETTYYINITGNSGTYTLNLRTGDGDGNSKYNAITVQEGYSSPRSITSSGEHWYIYCGTGDKGADTPVIFETTGDEVDTYMEVNKLEGSYWSTASDDNSGSGNNALYSFIPEFGETYAIKITTRNSTKGTYTFIVKEPTNNLRANPIPVSVGNSSSHTIYKNGAHWFKFTGTGDRVFFETGGNVVNSNIYIYVGDSSNYTYSKQENKGINFFTALGTIYYINITGNSGTYVFNVRTGEGDGNSKYNAITVQEGYSSSRSITSSGEHWYTYCGTGNRVTFKTTGNVVDTYMNINLLVGGSYGGEGSSDNDGDGNNALCTITGNEGATYVIKITARQSTSGQYTFVVQ